MPIVAALLFLFDSLIGLAILLVIVTAVLSWLVAFDVINLRNPMMYRIVRTLDQLTEPMLRPIRRFLPNLGGVDISPIILWLLLTALKIVVDGYLRPLAAGGAAAY
ncbi:YggT family protein [Caulobacter sp. S45]|uniref:YggT family protein n=1 Tax=Caulobacter sp. S45 TaxID=1641861 RepID=UPI001575092B|nr:YggT family protein [Caulobacter sp. S45]